MTRFATRDRYRAAILCFGFFAGQAMAADITERVTPAGRYLQDAKGLPLYFYARDVAPGVSTCVGDCAKSWPPLQPTAAAVTPATIKDFAQIAREGGAEQWAYRGRPLYRYAKDEIPSQPQGDRVGNAWSVAFVPLQTPPGIGLRALFVGRVLVDARGRSLYWRDDERPREERAVEAACERECLRNWSVVEAPLLANAVGEFRPSMRRDGLQQWTYRGKRLYLARADAHPGDTRGDGVDRVWRLAVLEAAPAPPAWVTVQASDMGEVFADAKGATLYTLGLPIEKIRKTTCDENCIRRNWRLVPSSAGATASGEWTLVKPPAVLATPGVKTVWAYKGDVLYTHTRDRGPGAIGGDKWAVGASGGTNGWYPVLRRRDYEE
ncbi:MAG: hypothetical protein EBZ40_07055 [Gammaproteobacteria bacterium]|jgi:hypothetical protein|nr:hypothetical protein [Gammaproteobacteria bacterium]